MTTSPIRMIPAEPDPGFAADATARELRIAIENSKTGIAWLSSDGIFHVVRAGYAKMLGYTADELRGKSWAATVLESDHPKAIAAVTKMLSNGRAVVDLQAVRKDGTVFDKQLLLVKTVDEDGHHTGHFCLMWDITKRKAAERALRNSQAFSDRLLDVIQDGVSVVDAEGRHIKVNAAFLRMTGFTENELIGKGVPHPYWPDEHRDAIQQAFSALPDGNSQHELFFCKKDGKRFPVIVSPAKSVDNHGNTVYIATIKDMSERKEAERRLNDAERLKTMGTLAGGIAHDLNNLLTPVLGYADALHKGMLSVDEASSAILSASKRAQELVGQLLQFARQDRETPKAVSLTEATQDALKFCQASLPANVAVETRFEAVRDTVAGVEASIQQVVMNLISNAGHAMSETGGTLGIYLHNPTADSVELVIRDTGTGIPPDLLHRIFEPFFTTKPVGEGTGLGLATVKNVVRDSGGTVQVEPAAGGGSRFLVRFPLCQKSEPLMLAGSEEPAGVAAGSLRVMLVDDQTNVLKVGAALLTHLGHTATSFSDPDEALAADPNTFDVVLSDYRMDGVTGLEFVRRIGELRVPVILVTGDRQNFETLPEGIAYCLQKPYTLNDLSKALRVAMNPG